MTEGSALQVAAYKHGTVKLYPLTGDLAERVREGLALLGDMSEKLPSEVLDDVPLPGKLVQQPRWHT